ncbi:MAG: twin-arginine translocation signal domain-containing protein, partial [Candidatus Latescibacteria bacterium]|nr:twin-arginine translocation signal domain-containing protein [Candidatus Latescibacterota bacterium]
MERFFGDKTSRRDFLKKGCLFLACLGGSLGLLDLLTKKAWPAIKTSPLR